MSTGAERGRRKGIPSSNAAVLSRARLDQLIEVAQTRRVTIVVAEAGFGKSTLLASWASKANCAWYTVTPEDRFYSTFARGIFDILRLRVPGLPPEIRATIEGGGSGIEQAGPRAQAFAAELSEALSTSLKNDLILVLDDVHEFGIDGPSVKVVEALCRGAPDNLHLVLSGRTGAPFPVERLRGQGEILEIQGPELTFTLEETSAFIEAFLDQDGAALAGQVHELTGGWPAAVRLTLEALANADSVDRKRRLNAIGSPGGQLFSYLAEDLRGRAQRSSRPPPSRRAPRTFYPCAVPFPRSCHGHRSRAGPRAPRPLRGGRRGARRMVQPGIAGAPVRARISSAICRRER